MSEKKPSPVLNFIRKNFYYLLIGASLIIIATVIAIVLATNGAKPSQSGSISITEKPSQSTPSESTPNESTPEESTPSDEPSSDKPVDNKIIFVMPVANSSIIKDYTSSTVVYNQTLGVYTGHMGIDFGAESGSEVYAVYAGRIESITTSYLKGTTITIDHGNGLKSIYNSIEALETLEEGQSVSAGQVIGSVSDNNRQEYKDGPHLHFEVTLDGEWVDPSDYLMITEK